MLFNGSKIGGKKHITDGHTHTHTLRGKGISTESEEQVSELFHLQPALMVQSLKASTEPKLDMVKHWRAIIAFNRFSTLCGIVPFGSSNSTSYHFCHVFNAKHVSL